MSWSERLALNWGGQIMLVAVVVVGSCILALRLRNRRMPYGLEPASTVLALGAALSIALVTLTPQKQTALPGGIQLHPFHTIRGYLHHGGFWQFVLYALGNIALFVPLGFCLFLSLRPVLRRLALPGAVVLTGLASMTVEILQIPIWSRSTDIDDVITNSLGGLGGAVLAFVGYAIYSWVRSKLPTRPAGPPDTRRYSYLDTREPEDDARQHRTALIQGQQPVQGRRLVQG